MVGCYGVVSKVEVMMGIMVVDVAMSCTAQVILFVVEVVQSEERVSQRD